MVGNLGNQSGDRDNQAEERENEIRLYRNHRESHHAIRRLLQDALTPLRVDPIPSEVLIRNIVITRDREGNLGISCEVLYAVAEG